MRGSPLPPALTTMLLRPPFPLSIPALAVLMLTALRPGGAAAGAESILRLREVASSPRGAEWKVLFDGQTLSGWKPSGFDGAGAVSVNKAFRDNEGAVVLEAGAYLSGITWTDASAVPRMNYEITLEAMKLAGADFFCGLTFPVGSSACSFIVGGWGGSVVGISCVDHSDASENDTTLGMEFVPNRWYRISVRVTEGKIEAWIDADKMVDLETAGRYISLRFGDIDKSLPLGIAAYQTKAAVRGIRWRRL